MINSIRLFLKDHKGFQYEYSQLLIQARLLDNKLEI